MHVRDERETRRVAGRLAGKRRRQRLGLSRHASVEGLARLQRLDPKRVEHTLVGLQVRPRRCR